jgi:hypothetical protein
MPRVLRHLAYDAWRSGTLAIKGRLDAGFAELIDRAFFLKRERRAFLIHTRHAEVERAVLCGDAFLTRLEGEWWVPYGDEEPGT